MEELLNMLIEYVGDEDYEPLMDGLLRNLIEFAIQEIMNVMYPNGILDPNKRAVVKNQIIAVYPFKILQIAEYHFDKQGKEGVILYSENDTSSHFESSGTPASYLKGIIPIAEII